VVTPSSWTLRWSEDRERSP